MTIKNPQQTPQTQEDEGEIIANKQQYTYQKSDVSVLILFLIFYIYIMTFNQIIVRFFIAALISPALPLAVWPQSRWWD